MASEKRVLSPKLPQEADSTGERTMSHERPHGNADHKGSLNSSADSIYKDNADTNAGTPRRSQSPTVDIDLVISMLRVPECGAEVAKQHANEHTADRQIQAYAKLAGRNWTYYVQQLEIVIGRSAADSAERVDIDLAPSKIISRRHAVIRYNLSSRQWEVITFGRNGLRLDGVLLRSGNTANLSSGNVIDVGNVQMMFVLPDADPVVAPLFIQKLQEKQQQQQQQMEQSASQSPKLGAASALRAPSGTASSAESVSHNSATAKPALAETAPEPSLAYPRGVTIVSRPQVPSSKYLVQDLGSDECKDIKPPFSYATMISQAILSMPDHMMTLAEIYAWISTHYAFYRHSKPGWQNSIRHNLSLNKAFEKVARKEHEPGKGSKWHIVDTYKDELIKKATVGRNNKGGYLPRKPFEVSPPSKAAQLSASTSMTGRKRMHSEAMNPPDSKEELALDGTNKSRQQDQDSQHAQGQPQNRMTSHSINQQPHMPMNLAQMPHHFQAMPPSQGSMPMMIPNGSQPQQGQPQQGQPQQAYQMSMQFQNMNETAPSFPVQGYPYLPPFGMPYYPQHPGPPMMSMMPMPPQQQVSDSQQIKSLGSPEDLQNSPEIIDRRSSGDTSSKDGSEANCVGSSSADAAAASDISKRANFDKTDLSRNATASPDKADVAAEDDESKRLGQDPSRADLNTIEANQLQTPARPFRGETRDLGETPQLGSSIKLPPQQGSAIPESSPTLWKYMNLESTPNNATTPASKNRNNAGAEDFGQSSSPTASGTNYTKSARQNNDVNRKGESMQFLEKLEQSKA